MSIAITILKALFSLLPTVLEEWRKIDAQTHAREVLEAQERAVALERLRRLDADLAAQQETQHATTETLKAKLAEALARDAAAARPR